MICKMILNDDKSETNTNLKESGKKCTPWLAEENMGGTTLIIFAKLGLRLRHLETTKIYITNFHDDRSVIYHRLQNMHFTKKKKSLNMPQDYLLNDFAFKFEI